MTSFWNMEPVRIPQTPGTVHLNLAPKLHPWGLSAGEMEVLTALVALGTPRAVALKTGKSLKTIEEQCRRARVKMKVKSNIQAALLWDRRTRAAA